MAGAGVFVLPFRTSREQFWVALLQWLTAGDSSPSNVLEETNFDGVQGVYHPFYHLHLAYETPWSASVGQPQTVVDHYAWENAPELFGEHEKEHRKRATSIIHWTQVSGDEKGTFVKTLPASGALPQDMLDGLFRKGDWAESARAFLPSREVPVSGLFPIPFTRPAEEVAAECTQRDLPPFIERLVRQEIAEQTHRDLTTPTRSKVLRQWRVLLPFWCASFTCGSGKYRVLADGEHLGGWVGTKPEAPSRSEVMRDFTRQAWRAMAIWGAASALALPVLWLLALRLGSESGHSGILLRGALALLGAVAALGWIPALGLFLAAPKRYARLLARGRRKKHEDLQRLLAQVPSPPSPPHPDTETAPPAGMRR